MPDTMKFVDIQGGKGGATALHISSGPVPTAKPHEAIVRIKAFGLNRADLLQREGNYPVPPGVTKILGLEFSGVVHTAASQGEVDFKPGDEVFGLAYGGAYAEYIAISTHMLIAKPAHLNWAEAASVPEAWMTATQALTLVGGFQRGRSVLWHAGASNVSLAGIQLARSEGAKAIYATAGTWEKCEFLVKELGATAAFNYREQDWVKELSKATEGKGVDLIVDYIGAGYFQQNLDAAARDGRIVMLGFLGGALLQSGANIAPILGKRLRIEGSTLRSRDEKYQGNLRDLVVEHAMPRFERGEYKVFVEKVFPWEQVVDAHQLMESNKTKGKIVCSIDWE